MTSNGEGIANIEERELPEVGVARVERPDPVLAQESREVGVGNDLPLTGKLPVTEA